MLADDRVLLLGMPTAGRGRLAASISKLGYAVTLAEEVAAAQALWQQEAFPIVVVDMRDQAAPIGELRVHMPSSALIVIGARRLAAVLDAWHAGADDYVPQPVRQTDLASALEHVLRTRAARAADLSQSQHSALAEFRRMAAELAHQINTPLIPILGMAGLLAEDLPLDHPSHEYAQAITDAAIRIRDITWMLADIAQGR